MRKDAESNANQMTERSANQGEQKHERRSPQWLSVQEVASIEGLTERAIQKRCQRGYYIARLVEGEKSEVWEIDTASIRSTGRRTATGNTNRSPNKRRKESEQKANRSPNESEPPLDLPVEDRSYSAPPPAPPDWKEREAELKEEIRWLRNANEQHQRDSIELRQLLKKALEIAPRQLTAAPNEPDVQRPQIQEVGPATKDVAIPSPDPVKSPAPRTPRPLWKVILGIR